MTPQDQQKIAVVDADVSEIVLGRWSPRSFSSEPVTADQLRSIFTAASWAASSRNEQPWRFVVGLLGERAREAILEALDPANATWARHAPVLFASFAKQTFARNQQPNGMAEHDLGAASATLSLEATRQGLYTHGMAGFDGEKLSRSLDVPNDFRPIACWALGHLGETSQLPEHYRDLETQPRTRKPLAEFAFGQWGQAHAFARAPNILKANVWTTAQVRAR